MSAISDDEFSVAAAPTPEGRQAALIVAAAEIAEVQKDLLFILLAPPTEHRVMKMAGVAAGLRRAAARISINSAP